MKRSAIGLILLFLSISSCGTPGLPRFDALVDRQPYVVAVDPADGATFTTLSAVTIDFSQPLEERSISERTLPILPLEEEDEAAIVEEAVDGELPGLAGRYRLEGEGRRIRFEAEGAFEAGREYLIVATPAILSHERIPLSQEPGFAATPFISRFRIGASAGGGGGSEGGSGGNGGGSASEGDVAPVVRNRPQHLWLNELLYDVPGSDSDGDVFVELGGDAGGDITGYRVVLINGDDGVIKDTITLPEDAIIPDDGIYLIADARTGAQGETNVPGADFVDTFDPQNGPDCVQLLDANGALLDALGYGEPLVAAAENGLACHEGTPAMKTVSGQSLSRVEGFDSNDNFIDFTFLDIPNPGEL